jgi:hypothetical protein
LEEGSEVLSSPEIQTMDEIYKVWKGVWKRVWKGVERGMEEGVWEG